MELHLLDLFISLTKKHRKSAGVMILGYLFGIISEEKGNESGYAAL